MANRVYGYQGYKGYQYETSPKKLEPEYDEPTDVDLEVKPNKKAKKEVQEKTVHKTSQHTKKMTKEELTRKMKLVCFIAVGFTFLFTISYRNSIINEKFTEKESLKADLAEIRKVNEQLEVSIENELNLTNVEASAKEKLGMAKLNNNQKVYINLPKKEYVEATSAGISQAKSQNFYEEALNKIKEFFRIG